MKNKLFALVAIATASFAQAGDQDVYITEFMYKGLFGEFVEVTNTASTPVNVTGWKFSDNAGLGGLRTMVYDTGSVTLGLNESVIVTEVSAALFRLAWYTDSTEGTPLSLKGVYGNNNKNLGRSDAANIYTSANVLVDTITYIDTDEAADTGASEPLNTIGVRTEDVSAIPGTLGADVFSAWVLSAETAGADTAWKAGAPGAPGPLGTPGVYPNVNAD